MPFWTYVNPFKRNHCVVHAFTHAAHFLGKTNDAKRFAIVLANAATRAGHFTESGKAQDFFGNLEWWVRACGLRLKRTERNVTCMGRGISLGMWVKEHSKGVYVVVVRGHAVCVNNGVIYGYYKHMTRVIGFAELEA